MRVTRGCWRRRVWAGLSALLCLCALGLSAAAQPDDGRWENGVTEAWWVEDFRENVGEAQALWNRIGEENLAPGAHEWAGDYFTGGDTHGTFMRWSPRAGFVIAHVDRCQAKLMGLTYGRASSTPALVEFFPEFSKRISHHGAHSPAPAPASIRSLPVRWRGRHLLVREDEMADFGDYVAGLGEYNGAPLMFLGYEAFPVRLGRRAGEAGGGAAEAGGENGAAESPPAVPPGYEHFIKRPIDARVIAVRRGRRVADPENPWWDNFAIPLTINRGAAHGVRPGMTLRAVGSTGFGGTEETVEVRRVGTRTSEAVLTRTIRKKPCVRIDDTDNCAAPDYAPVRVGWALTTGIPGEN